MTIGCSYTLWYSFVICIANPLLALCFLIHHNVQSLVLSKNKIKEWPGEILRSLNNLSRLKLDYNPLRQVTQYHDNFCTLLNSEKSFINKYLYFYYTLFLLECHWDFVIRVSGVLNLLHQACWTYLRYITWLIDTTTYRKLFWVSHLLLFFRFRPMDFKLLACFRFWIWVEIFLHYLKIQHFLTCLGWGSCI